MNELQIFQNKEFGNAKEYLESWSPEVNISLKIKEYNSQLSMNLDA